MTGIVSWGAYIPRYRIERKLINAALGRGGGAGERSVCNHDEDSITMAVEAVTRCIPRLKRMKMLDVLAATGAWRELVDAGSTLAPLFGGSPATPSAPDWCRAPGPIEALFLATTTSAFREKEAAALVAAAADLRQDISTADVSSSLKCGLTALRFGLDSVQTPAGRSVVVVASDCRPAEPGTPFETSIGDAAGAIVVGNRGVVAEFKGSFSQSGEFSDVWRKARDEYPSVADDKLVTTYGFPRFVKAAVNGLIEKLKLDSSKVDRVAIAAPDAGALKSVQRELPFKPEQYFDDLLHASVGFCGSAHSLLLLIAVLEASGPGQNILVCSYGSGSEAMLFETTPAHGWVLEQGPKHREMADQLAHKRQLQDYITFLKLRGQFMKETIKPFASPALLLREQKANLRLYCQRCRKCGAIQYPWRRVCWKCSAKDEFDEIPLPRTGKVFTFAVDHLPPSPTPPTIMASADIEGGGRFYGQITDCNPKDVTIGMPVELCFRRMHEGEDMVNYFWKFTPVS